jgi:hypothetical protein
MKIQKLDVEKSTYINALKATHIRLNLGDTCFDISDNGNKLTIVKVNRKLNDRIQVSPNASNSINVR